MILGAGSNQVPAIKKAVACGYYVITVDYLPDNIGHRYSHRYVNCSTIDEKCVLNAAEMFNIDGITTFASDIAIPSVAYVAEQLDLPGCNLDVAEKMSNKGKFRQTQQEFELRHPHFALGKRFDKIHDELHNLQNDIMFKPVDTSGSRGISCVNRSNLNQYEEAFHVAQKFSRTRIVCAEEFIKGVDITGDGLISGGKLKFIVFTQKNIAYDFVVTGHFIPALISKGMQRSIIEEVEANCAAVGYKDGPIDFDVRLTSEHPFVIEMTPRLGGNGIPDLIEHATGIDITTLAIEFVMGELLSIPFNNIVEKPCGSLIFGSECSGLIKNIAAKEEVCEAIPEIFSCIIKYQVGDNIQAFNHGGNSIGEILFDCSTPSHYDEIVKRFFKALCLRVFS